MSGTAQLFLWPEIRLHAVSRVPSLPLTPDAYAVRVGYRKVSPLTVIAVTGAGAANPVPSERGITVRHLSMSEETLGDVDRAIEVIEATPIAETKG